jgi:hypothetical protein
MAGPDIEKGPPGEQKNHDQQKDYITGNYTVTLFTFIRFRRIKQVLVVRMWAEDTEKSRE